MVTTTSAAEAAEPGQQEDPIAPWWNWMIEIIRQRNASDVDLSEVSVDGQVATQIAMRINNVMEVLQTVPGMGVKALLGPALACSKRAGEELEADMPDVDWAFTIGSQRFRANAGYDHRGLTASLRPLPSAPPPPDKLGLDPKWLEFLQRQSKGLVLVTGQTGSGKSSTLAAILQWLNEREQRKIITLEDPIEYELVPVKSIIHHREVGTHTKSFATCLRAALRQNPDIILVGEMRDPETIRIALRAAVTGHLVFGTMHCGNVKEVPGRIFNEFPAAEERSIRADLGDSLRMVIAQTLLAKRGSGRVAWREVMIGSDTSRAIIQNGNVTELETYMHSGGKLGMMTFAQSLTKLRSAITDIEWDRHKPREIE